MAAGRGVPGIAVAMSAAGALLVYTGYRGGDPLSALRDLATGKPKGFAGRAAARQALYEGIGAPGADSSGAGAVQASLGTASGPHPEFVTAAGHHANEQYSQLRRWQDGYSDCSSFVGKALKDCGITPPGASTTSSYLAWRMLTPISRSEVGAGDLLVSGGHMVMAINNTTAIGQQNARENVQVGPISNLMWGQSFVCLRYTGGASAAPSTGSSAGSRFV